MADPPETDFGNVSEEEMPVQELTQLSDEELLQRIAQGDEDALMTLYDRYGRLVYSLAYKILQDHQLAEEVTQDVFTSVWRAAPTFDPRKSRFTTWLTSIARNRSIDILRRRRARGLTGPGEAELNTAITRADERFSPEHHLQALAVREALQQLPPAQREVLELAYFGGLTQREISEQLGIPLGTVKTRMRLGMLKLRDLLSPNGQKEETLSSPKSTTSSPKQSKRSKKGV